MSTIAYKYVVPALAVTYNAFQTGSRLRVITRKATPFGAVGSFKLQHKQTIATTEGKRITVPCKLSPHITVCKYAPIARECAQSRLYTSTTSDFDFWHPHVASALSFDLKFGYNKRRPSSPQTRGLDAYNKPLPIPACFWSLPDLPAT